MGCISSNTAKSVLTCTLGQGDSELSKDQKVKEALAFKIVAAIKEPNQLNGAKRLREIVKSSPYIDWTAVHGHDVELFIDESLSFNTQSYTPVLLALALNKLELCRYFLEEVGLSLSLALTKPLD